MQAGLSFHPSAGCKVPFVGRKRERWGQDIRIFFELYPMVWKEPREESEDLALHSAPGLVTLDKWLNLSELWFLHLRDAANNA